MQQRLLLLSLKNIIVTTLFRLKIYIQVSIVIYMYVLFLIYYEIKQRRAKSSRIFNDYNPFATADSFAIHDARKKTHL